MKLHCPHCGVKGSAEDSYSGRKVRCPKCQGVFAVQPDMALELPEDTTHLSTTPVEPSLSANQVETTTIADVQIGEPGTDGTQPIEEAEELVVVAEDLAQPEAEADTTLPEEEALDWEDVASEIDLQLAEDEEGEEQEEPLENSPADVNLLQDEFEKPAADIGFSGEEGQAGDEIREDIIVETEEESAENEVADLPEAAESVAIAESKEQEEEGAQEEVQVVAETKEIEKEPYGIDQEQCWQCGKNESVGESFIAKDGRLYCTGCLPAEEPEKAAVASQEQHTDDTILTDDVTNESSDNASLGGVIRKAWLKIKNAFSS